MQTFNIGLSGWIIQDGNYGDLSVGETRKFALEFIPSNFQIISKGPKQSEYLRDSRYRVSGEVIFLNHEVWVMDFGILAFQSSRPPREIDLGNFVEAEIYLGVDPFSYFERLYKTKGIPPLIYDWKIEEIKIETAPFIEHQDELGRKSLTRDESKSALKSIAQTDAWSDDNGNAEYVLLSKKLDGPPSFEL